jgi:hypothetical protein
MSCDPTVQYCPDGCQGLVDKMYYDCDDVCLPDGYYFDPRKRKYSLLIGLSCDLVWCFIS